MKRNIIFLTALLALCCAFAPAAKAAKDPVITTDMLMGDHKVIELTDKYLALLTRFFPEDAARLGILGYHSSLDARDKQSEATRKESIVAMQDTLNHTDWKSLSPSKQIDYHILKQIVDRKVFDIETRNRLAKDPLWYLESIDAVYDILLKDYKLGQERLTDALKRLQSLPTALASGKENLQNPPDLFLRLALERAGTAYTSFNDITLLMNRMAQDDYTKEQIKIISADAKKAIKDYFDFIKNMSENKQYVDFRLGPDNFNKLLSGVYGINTPIRKITQNLEKDIETSRAELIAALTPMIEAALPEEEKAARITKKGIIEIRPADYYLAAEKHNKGPKNKDIMDTFVNYYNESAEFFTKKEIFTQGELRVLISAAPKFMQRKYETASYLPPFPFAGKRAGDLLVNLPSDPQEAAKVMPRLFTYSKIKINSVAHLSSGSHLMYSAAENFTNKILKISPDPFYINGWVKYSLRTAQKQGYFNQDEDSIHLAWYNYKTALLALAELSMHSGERNYTQSLEYLTEAGIESEEASAGLDIAAAAPCTYLSAAMGSQEFYRLRKKYQSKIGSKFKLNEFHEKMLSTGRVPLPFMEKALELAYQKKEADTFFNTLYF